MRKFFFLLLLLPAFPLFAQRLEVVLQWDTTHQPGYFSHALYADGSNTLPYYSRKIPWNENDQLPRVRIEQVSSTPLQQNLPDSIDQSRVQEEPWLEYKLAREAGQAWVLVKVLPFIRSKEGQLSRVERFEIQVQGEMALAPLKSQMKGQWSEHSALASGNWYRVAVRESGMHRLSYEQLADMGLENPASVRIYGHGAQLLPERFSQGYIDDLQAIPLHLEKGSDGLFGPGDYLLFYAQGPVYWSWDEESQMYLHRLHPYSREGCYFVTDAQGAALEAGEEPSLSENPTHTVTSYDRLLFREDEKYNLIHSGREWFGDLFNIDLDIEYAFSLEELIPGENMKLRARTAARSGNSSSMSVFAGDQMLGNITMSGANLGLYTSTFAYEAIRDFTFLPEDQDLRLTLVYNRPDDNSQAWLNYLTLNYRAGLRFSGGQTLFRDSRSVGSGNITQFRVQDAGAGSIIWEITDPDQPRRILHQMQGSEARFTLETSTHRSFLIFTPGADFPSPDYLSDGLGLIENQDLHGMDHPDMLIVSPALLKEEADRLAGFRRENDNLNVAVVLQQEIFNEFSSGTPDVSALRNFMKMFYDRSDGAGDQCRYLLLFGDGSYDNRGTEGKQNNTNLLLTYQSPQSLIPTRSYVSDDFFALLDTDEEMYDGLLDIGVGRLPASDLEEAAALVDKIIAYSDKEQQGDWRNLICFIGDDEDGNLHMRQADELASYVETNYPSYNIKKVYLDAYPQQNLATGPSYPDVTRAINNQVNRGALIVNYTGHGSPNGLAHEKIMTKSDILGWSNQGKLPLFLTATCEFSRYDEYDLSEDVEDVSAGEMVLLNATGGGIGLFTTTRLVYAGPNHSLNEKFYEVVFEKDQQQRNYRLGDIIVYAKNNTGSGINKRNFTLLGDPSMRLTYPRHRVITDSINGLDVNEASDTLSAFQWVQVSGHLESETGQPMNDFNGLVYPRVYDKEKLVETLSNDKDPIFNFYTRENLLYSGKASVKAGAFSFGFYVPKDISYAYGPGKISYYGSNESSDAHGSFENFTVGGIGQENAQDAEPPQIELYMNDTLFVNGGITDSRPTLLARVTDNFGINTTGNGIGHDLTATLDGDRVNAAILNQFYQANNNSHNSGTIRYPYSKLEPGKHEVVVKIWDIHNNSAEAILEFVVMESEAMLLEELYNYPNPFFDRTWFNMEHNRPGEELQLVLDIFDLSGRLVRRIERDLLSDGYRIEPVEWDGRSSGGARVGGGIYFYRAILRTTAGEMASSTGKLILSR